MASEIKYTINESKLHCRVEIVALSVNMIFKRKPYTIKKGQKFILIVEATLERKILFLCSS